MSRVRELGWRFPRLYSIGGRVLAAYMAEVGHGHEIRVASFACEP